jgi:anti-anti-sigma factor
MPQLSGQDIPTFEIASEVADGFYVVRVTGELDMSHEEDLRAALRGAADKGTDEVIVDLTNCEFIDSSGVRVLLLGHEAQRNGAGGGLAVAASTEQIVRILSVMGVDQAIPVRPTIDEAVSALRG